MSFIAAFLGAAVLTGLLVHLALCVGWVDDRTGLEYRKLMREPVALVGGAGILLGVLMALGLDALGDRQPWKTFGEAVALLPWPGLLAAFLLGLLDDVIPGGMTARVKFGGQLLVAALVATYPGAAFIDASALQCVGLGILALVAMNAVNLFDHADGLVGLLCAMAMLAGAGPHSRVFAAAAAGYLPFNLIRRRRSDHDPADVGQERVHAAPFAMLGDSGSHMVGVLIATTPGAWWFLALPLLDMIRVVLGRLRRGVPFWRGDRTHIGHLLQDIGFSNLTAAVLVGLALVPPLFTIALMDGPAPLASGLLAGAALYFGMLVMADGNLDETLVEARSAAAASGGGGATRGGRPGEDVSVSDVFARASGGDEDPAQGSLGSEDGSKGRKVLWARGRAADGENHDSERGAGPRGGAGGPDPVGEAASGPFAAPSPPPADEGTAGGT